MATDLFLEGGFPQRELDDCLIHFSFAISLYHRCLLRLLLPARPRRRARTALMHGLAQAEVR